MVQLNLPKNSEVKKGIYYKDTKTETVTKAVTETYNDTLTQAVTGLVSETYSASQTTNITGTLDLDASTEVDVDAGTINLN